MHTGNTSGSLLFYDQLLSIALMGTWGAISDLMGRRVVFVFGFFFMYVRMVGQGSTFADQGQGYRFDGVSAKSECVPGTIIRSVHVCYWSCCQFEHGYRGSC